MTPKQKFIELAKSMGIEFSETGDVVTREGTATAPAGYTFDSSGAHIICLSADSLETTAHQYWKSWVNELKAGVTECQCSECMRQLSETGGGT